MQKAKITVSGVSRNSEGVSRLETVNTGTFGKHRDLYRKKRILLCPV